MRPFGDPVGVKLSGTISLQFSISEQTDELEHVTYILPDNSSEYPEKLNERHDPATLLSLTQWVI